MPTQNTLTLHICGNHGNVCKFRAGNANEIVVRVLIDLFELLRSFLGRKSTIKK